MTIQGWEVVADVVGHLAWPALIITIILLFRKQIATFIAEVEEADWGGAKVKRGNQLSKNLKEEAAEADAVTVIDLDAEPAPLVTPTEQPNADLSAPTPSASSARLLTYYGRIVVERLRTSKYNTDTTSARLAAEIVGNTYADLKQSIRFVAFVVRGSGGTRGVIPGLQKNLEVLELPEDLDRDIRDARQLALDVTEKRVRVSGEGASDYIDSVRLLVTRVVNWASVQSEES
jgi:hypothetical protein